MVGKIFLLVFAVQWASVFGGAGNLFEELGRRLYHDRYKNKPGIPEQDFQYLETYSSEDSSKNDITDEEYSDEMQDSINQDNYQGGFFEGERFYEKKRRTSDSIQMNACSLCQLKPHHPEKHTIKFECIKLFPQVKNYSCNLVLVPAIEKKQDKQNTQNKQNTSYTEYALQFCVPRIELKGEADFCSHASRDDLKKALFLEG